MTAELMWRQLVDRSEANSVIVECIKKTDLIVWDEASMSSQRMFELVNLLHHEISPSTRYAFNGKQMILVGEFLQLQPVPSLFDEACFMFRSPLFDATITHRFGLTKVMRQDKNDKTFLKALSSLRLGYCDDECELFLKSLERALPTELEEKATHIFFRKLSVAIHNRIHIDNLPGVLLEFSATYENETSKTMSWPGVKTLQIKIGCKVMLVWNLSTSLKNGSTGVVTGVSEDNEVQVLFPGVGVQIIRRQTWIKRDRTGQKTGSVTQFPIVLAYAVTCHKSQGLTLPAAVVHCSREYVSGLIYVALSRVKSAAHLQVLGFSRRQLLKPYRESVEISTSRQICDPVPDFSCCRRRILDDDLFTVHDRYLPEADDTDVPLLFPHEMSDGPVQASFEADDVNIGITLMETYEDLIDKEAQLESPPARCIEKSLQHLQDEIWTEQPLPSTFVQEQNEALEYLLSGTSRHKLIRFINVAWYESYLLMKKYVFENPDEVIVNIDRQGFTTATSSLHELFVSPRFSHYVCCVFDAPRCTLPQRSVLVELVRETIFWEFLEELSTMVSRSVGERRDEAVNFDVDRMSDVGKSKVRHVGGWAVRKVLNDSRRYIKENVQTKSASTLAAVREKEVMCHLIEENIVQPFSDLEENSIYPETLAVTENRQFRERGLLHISDKSYEFFIELERRRVELLNGHALRRRKEEMVGVAQECLQKDEELMTLWLLCFCEDAVIKNKAVLKKILDMILSRYVRMGASQFLRDFRRQWSIQKSAELRKRVLQKKEREKEKSDSVPIEDIKKDHSEGKKISHARLLAFLHQHENYTAFNRVYKKEELSKLCVAYGCSVPANSKKEVFSRHLLDVIPKHDCIPFTSELDDRPYHVTQSTDTDGHIRLRISRGKLYRAFKICEKIP